jgi:putative ATP-dependent endonuclease of the OLD family
MRLEAVTIKGFRCFQNETCIPVEAFTAILGRNDVGKSSILEALQLFFDDTAPEAGDVCVHGDKEVRIVCVFGDPPPALVLDADFQTTLEAEYLLNENGKLEVHKVYDGSLKTPKLTNTQVKALHPTAPGVSDLLKLKNKELKERADKCGIDFDHTPKNINSALRRAIWASAADLALAPTLLDASEEGTKQIWSQLKECLPVYALFKADRPSTDQDAEAQDPMKAAVAEALKAHEGKLEELRQAVESSVMAVARLTVEKLAEIDPSLAKELNPTVQKPNWSSAFKIGLTDDSAIPINKRGSGVRRMILMNFFRARAERRNEAAHAPGVIYAIEEPETSQHPRNQKLLLRAFFELSEQPGCQVLITTHNPVLARELPTKSLRLVRRDDEGAREVLAGNEEVYQRAATELGVLPDHGVRAFIGVEGTNDVNFLKRLSKLLANSEADIPNLAIAEEEGRLIFIPLGGSNLSNWVGRLAHLNRPEFHLFDRDTAPPVPPKYEADAQRINAQAGGNAFHTDVREIENYIHPDAIRAEWPHVNWPGHGPYSDVPCDLAIACVQAAGKNWADLDGKARQSAELGIKVKLNTKAVERMTPDLLTQSDPQSVLRNFLRQVGTALNA